ncbi:MAG: DUF4124 domain-containing protein [Nitrosomonadales bacterium]|nr:DUF4124 domain-containing protein [Nitrosomonadales bacterium]
MTDKFTHHPTKLPKGERQAAGYKSGLLVALAIVGVTFSLPAAAKMYKWVDDQGVTHYGETVPPEYANKNRTELNQSGRVVKTQDVLTPEERRAERDAKEQAEAKKREEEKADLERERRDKMLVNTYSNVAEIDLARKRNLQQIELRISGINAQIKLTGDNLLGLQKEADGYTATNRKIPPSLQEDLQQTQARLDKLQKDLEKPAAEKAALEARYDADKARYRELTGK